MARDGNGNYQLPTGNPVTTGTLIESTWANSTMADLALALTQSLSSDGQTKPIANLPMNGFKFLNVAEPTLRNQFATLGMVQDSRQGRVTITGGAPDNLTGTVIGQMTSYYPGQLFSFAAPADSLGPVTLNINGIGPRAIVTSGSNQLQAGDLLTGTNYLVMFDGAVFRLVTINSADVNLVENLEQNCISGWDRPNSGTYPELTIVDNSTITVPSGRGRIIPAGEAGVKDVIEVTWPQQDLPLTNLSSTSTTTVVIDAGGVAREVSGNITPAAYRDFIVVGVVSHLGGAIVQANLRPAIFGDNGYLFRDSTNLLNRVLVNGGRPIQGSSGLFLTVLGGQAFIDGGNPNDINNPNYVSFETIADVEFYTLSGPNTLSLTKTQTAPITMYDPDGVGVTENLGGNNRCTIHRLYFIYGEWVWVYGQRRYDNLATATANLAVDRALYQASPRVNEGVLVAEIIAARNTANLSDQTRCILVPRGGFEFTIGSSGSIDDAPSDGRIYGRKDGTWQLAGKDVLTDIETRPLGDGQTEVFFTNNIVNAAIYINGPDADNGRLVPGIDYTYDEGTQRLTLAESRPAGTTVSAERGGEFDPAAATAPVVYDTEVDLAAATLPVGTFVTTKGRFAAGDSLGSDWVIEAPVDPSEGRDFLIANGNIARYQTKVDAKSGRRNLLINGNFRIWQRNNDFTLSDTAYTADRWVGGTLRTYTRVDDVPAGSIFKHSMYVVKNAAANMFCKQEIELAGQGVAGEFFVGQVLTCSGYVKVAAGKRVQLTTQFREQSSGGNIVNDLPATDIIVGDGDWQYFEKTWTISGIVDPLSRAYEVNISTINDATVEEMYLTGIQLEIGQQATPYEDIPVAELIALCQRYYQTVKLQSYEILPIARASSANQLATSKVLLPVKMRTTPTGTTKDLAARGYRLANGTQLGPGTRTFTPTSDGASYRWVISGWAGAATTPQAYAVMIEVASPKNPETFGLDAEL